MLAAPAQIKKCYNNFNLLIDIRLEKFTVTWVFMSQEVENLN